MPTRLLREGILSSERVNRLSDGAEIFYRRLISVVDDYACYFANPMLLRAACYPLRIDRVTDADILGWLGECEAAGLVRVYDSGRHLEIQDFRQAVRAKNRRFPAPEWSDAEHMHSTCVAPASQMQTDVHLDVCGYGDGCGDESLPSKDEFPDVIWKGAVA